MRLPPQKARETGAQRLRNNHKEQYFWIQQGGCADQLTAIVTACLMPAQSQTRENPNTEKEKWAQYSSPYHEIICN